MPTWRPTPRLGRPLAGGAANLAIDLVAPYTVFLDRRNELDMRFGKVLRWGRTKYVVSMDVFNALNTDVAGEREPELRRVAAPDADPEREAGEVQRAVRLLKTRLRSLRSPVLAGLETGTEPLTPLLRADATIVGTDGVADD